MKEQNFIKPDWKLAKIHAKSVKPGLFTNNQNYQICECCYNSIPQQKIPICIHAKQLQFLGFGFPLWYTFLKYCSILILMLIISIGVESIYHAISANSQFCSEYYWGNGKMGDYYNEMQIEHQHRIILRHNNKVEHMSEVVQQQSHSNNHPHDGQQHSLKCTGIFVLLSRIDKKVTDFDVVTRVTGFILTLLTLAFMRDNLYKTEKYYDERKCSNSDYSVILSKLPKIQGIESALKRFFEQQFVPGLCVQEIILIPEYEQLEQIQHDKKSQITKLQKLIKHQQQNQHENPEDFQKIITNLKQLQAKQKQEIQLFKKQMMHDQLPCERAIVVLNTEQEKETSLKEFQEMDKEELVQYFGPQSADIQIDQAPEPREIIWQNINYPAQKRFFRICLGWGLSILFILFVTLIFYFILKAKTHIVQQQKSLKLATIIVYIAILSVILFNKFVLGNVLHHLTDLQKHSTADRYQFSFAFKYALGMFSTTALMTLFVEAFTYNNFYTHHYGVIEQESIMFFMNSLLVPIIWFINPFQIFILIKRNINYGKKHFTQKQANKIMEDFRYDIGKRYAEILQSMWFTFLYASLIPMGSFLTLIGIGLYYWVDKYNLLRRSSVHENISGKLSLIAMKLLDAVLIFLPLGQIIFDSFLRNTICISSIVCLLLGIIYLLLPINDILDFLQQQRFNLQSKKYQDVKHTFQQHYFDLHPIYKKTHSEYNRESRLKYKQEMVRRYSKPIFSFIQDSWLVKGNQQINNSQNMQVKM